MGSSHGIHLQTVLFVDKIEKKLGELPYNIAAHVFPEIYYKEFIKSFNL